MCPYAERILHQRIERACFFVGGIDETLDVTKKPYRRTVEQMKTLLEVIEHIADDAETTDTRPVKVHWTRIKALSRRFAEGFADEYDTLKPVGEFKRELDGQIYRMLQRPVRWDGPEPTDDDKQLMIDALAKEISREVTALCSRRINSSRRKAWQEAYAEFGQGSTSAEHGSSPARCTTGPHPFQG
jgi:hypothetical protein